MDVLVQGFLYEVLWLVSSEGSHSKSKLVNVRITIIIEFLSITSDPGILV